MATPTEPSKVAHMDQLLATKAEAEIALADAERNLRAAMDLVTSAQKNVATAKAMLDMATALIKYHL